MKPVRQLIPDASHLLALGPGELAGVLLEYLKSLPPQALGSLNRHNFFNPSPANSYPPQHRQSVQLALIEAWAWLEREALLSRAVTLTAIGLMLSRRAQQIAERTDFEAFRRASLLSRERPHRK
ncbi:MAG: hypothetical protein ACRD2H_13065 [Terriglobales bacterium]